MISQKDQEHHSHGISTSFCSILLMQSTITYCFQPVVQRPKGDSKLLQRHLQAGRLTFPRQKLTSPEKKKKKLKMRGTQTLKEIQLMLKRKQRKNLGFKQEVEAYLNIHRQTGEA